MDINIECKDEYSSWDVDFEWVKNTAKSVLEYFLSLEEIADGSCLKGYEYQSISFDFLFTDSGQTHSINLEYRSKDYPADIITFAVFADCDENERFVLDGDINLGEIIIALDKMTEGANEKGISKEDELAFFISHGIMHLLGFDHLTMSEYNFVIEWQKKALGSININYDKI